MPVPLSLWLWNRHKTLKMSNGTRRHERLDIECTMSGEVYWTPQTHPHESTGPAAAPVFFYVFSFI